MTLSKTAHGINLKSYDQKIFNIRIYKNGKLLNFCSVTILIPIWRSEIFKMNTIVAVIAILGAIVLDVSTMWLSSRNQLWKLHFRM